MRTDPSYSPKTRSTYAHPGEVLLERFLVPRGLSCSALARATGVRSPHIHEIVRGRRNIKTETAIRFGLALGTSARYWLNLQVEFDLAKAQHLGGASFSDVELIGAAHPSRR